MMSTYKDSKLILINAAIWGVIFFSGLALVYHIRWFVPFLTSGMSHVVPVNQLPGLWFVVQICNNLIFIISSILLIRLFQKYKRTGFFDTTSKKVLNTLLFSCIILAVLGSVQTIANNFYEVHFDEWTSVESIANLVFRSFTRLLVFREPQTMYLLVAAILWAVRQFVTKALIVKEENEAFV
jgi:hypothetical protein